MDKLLKKLRDDIRVLDLAMYDCGYEPNYTLFGETLNDIVQLTNEIETMWNRRNV